MERQTLFPPIFLRVTTSTASSYATPPVPVAPPPPSVIYSVFDRTSSQAPVIVTALSASTLSSSAGGARFLNEGWAIALTVLTSIRLVLTLCLWAYLTYRTVQLRVCLGRVWLSQLLLAALALSHVVLYAFVTQPTHTSCAIIRLGVGLAYVLPLAILVLKLLLIAATQKGYDVPRFCQGLLLVGFVGIQMAIGIQWLALVTPASSHRFLPTGGATCGVSIFDWLQHLIYVKLLLLIGTILAVVTHDSKANHREALFLGISLGFSIPIWIVWALTGSLLRDRVGIEDKCVAFGLLAITTLILFIMFIPRSRQSVAIGEGGLYSEDAPDNKPISELTVHKLYYPVYQDQDQNQHHKPQRVSFMGSPGQNPASSSGGGHARQDSADGMEDLNREDISSMPRANHHWYPPLRDTVQSIGNTSRGTGGRSLYSNNRIIRPYHYPSMASTSSASSPTNACNFDDVTSVHRAQVNNASGDLYLGTSGGGLKGRCLTPPSEEGSTTPSDGQESVVGGGASNDDSDLDIANFTERNVDGVSYNKVNRLPMY